MLLIKKEKARADLQNVTFRVESKLLKEFRDLTKELGFKQVTIIESAIKMAIEEMKTIKKDSKNAK